MDINLILLGILIGVLALFFLIVIFSDLFFICDNSDRKIIKEKNIKLYGDVSKYVASSRETKPDVTYYYYNTSNDKLPSIDKEKLEMGLCVAGGLAGYFGLYVLIGILSGGVGFIGLPLLMMFDNK